MCDQPMLTLYHSIKLSKEGTVKINKIWEMIPWKMYGYKLKWKEKTREIVNSNRMTTNQTNEKNEYHSSFQDTSVVKKK